MTVTRNVLIVLAHPDAASFNHALAGAAATALRRAGHSVTVCDLATEGFRADAGPHDVIARADETRFHLQAEQAHAARDTGYAPDIARHQALVAEADNVILQFPLWWGGPPALMKGWIDRVLSYGFAYVDGRRFDTGLFHGRRALISVTTGGTRDRFSDQGAYGPIGPLLMPIRRLTLEYMGFAVEEPQIAYAAPRVSQEVRAQYLDDLAAAALAMASRPVLKTDTWKQAVQDSDDAGWAKNR